MPYYSYFQKLEMIISSEILPSTNLQNLSANLNVHLHDLTRFTFMLPCVIIDFFLNNQPDALIIPILLCYKTLYVSGIFSVHHQEFSTVHSALLSYVQISDDRFQAESVPSWLCLEAVVRNLHVT